MHLYLASLSLTSFDLLGILHLFLLEINIFSVVYNAGLQHLFIRFYNINSYLDYEMFLVIGYLKKLDQSY